MGAEQAWVLAAVPAGMFVVLALFGRWAPRKGDWLGVLAIGTSFVLFFFVLADFLHQRDALVNHAGYWSVAVHQQWSDVGGFVLNFGTYVDPITIVMLGVVTT